jgi:hypothetical protein
MAKSKSLASVISSNEAYAKHELMSRLNISQKFWDKMLDDGLPCALVGHTKWVTGRQVIEYLETHSEMKTAPNNQVG